MVLLQPAGQAGLLLGAGLASVALSVSAPAFSQAVPQKVAVQAAPSPGTRFEPPPGAVVDDPNRVFGDEAPDFAPLAIVGALGLRPFASLVTQYDDNIARQPSDAPLNSRFRSRADWIFRPTVGVRAERPVGRQRLFLNASLGRAIYAKNSQLNNTRINVGGGAGFVLGRTCGGQVSAGYSKRDQLIGNFEDAADATAESTFFSSVLNCSTATGLTGSVGYNRGRQTNRTSDPSVDRSFADARRQSVNGSIGYRLGQRGQVGIAGSWGENVFPNQLVLGEENQNEVTSISLFGNYRVGSALSATAGFGQSKVSSQVPGSQSFSGNTWNLGLGYAGPRFGANLAVSRGINGGGNQGANFAIATNLTGSVTYQLNDAMRLSTGYVRTDSDFRGTALIPETNQIQSMTTDRVFVGADYRLRRLLSFGFDLNYQQRSSVPDIFSFKSTSAIFTVTARF
jgi:hypothetical protein